jgi:hypothetical protein
MIWFLRWLESRLPKTTITVNGKPYLTRCYLFGKDRTWGNIYLHHFHSSDQGDELHNHPWVWGLSLVLAGGYYEERVVNPFYIDLKEREDRKARWHVASLDLHYDPMAIDEGYCCGGHHDVMADELPPLNIEKRDIKPGGINLIRVTDFHRVDLKDEKAGAWTLFFTGPRSKDWGFLDRHTSEFTDWRCNPEAIP